MKNLAFLLVVVFYYYDIHSQSLMRNQDEKGEFYAHILSGEAVVKPYNIFERKIEKFILYNSGKIPVDKGQMGEEVKSLAAKGLIFDIIEVDDSNSGYVIRFWEFPNEKMREKKFTYSNPQEQTSRQNGYNPSPPIGYNVSNIPISVNRIVNRIPVDSVKKDSSFIRNGIHIDTSFYIVRYKTDTRQILGTNSEIPISNGYNNVDYKGLYYFMSKKDFEIFATRYYPKKWSFSFGTLVIPVKMRFGNSKNRYFDFATDFTLGSSIGVRKRISHFNPYYINLLGGFGITSVSIDSSLSKGFVESQTRLAAVTPSIGLLFEFNGVQVGAFSGLDFLSGKVGRNWQYQGQPWLSVGLGYQIMSRNTESNRNNFETKQKTTK